MDANHDGKLSITECERAFDVLEPLDLAEAEAFAPFQLTGFNSRVNGDFVASGDAGQNMAGAARPRLAVKLLGFSNSASSLGWADRIRQHFSLAGSKGSAPKNLVRR